VPHTRWGRNIYPEQRPFTRNTTRNTAYRRLVKCNYRGKICARRPGTEAKTRNTATPAAKPGAGNGLDLCDPDLRVS
jgi:hypothetical protein